MLFFCQWDAEGVKRHKLVRGWKMHFPPDLMIWQAYNNLNIGNKGYYGNGICIDYRDGPSNKLANNKERAVVWHFDHFKPPIFHGITFWRYMTEMAQTCSWSSRRTSQWKLANRKNSKEQSSDFLIRALLGNVLPTTTTEATFNHSTY